MFSFCKKIFFVIRNYSWKSIYRRSIEIVTISLFHPKKCKTIVTNEEKEHHNNISIVAIVKNESKYIREWIEYHLIIGVDHFYIYDNESEDNLKEVLHPYIDKGIVSYFFCPGSAMQTTVYNDAIARLKDFSHWMAFIDIDEFIVLNPNYSTNLSQFLEMYERFDMLGINWCVFDANNHEKSPTKGFVISNYTRCHAIDDNSANRHIKCIVKPKSVKICTNPHYMILKPSKKAVDENFDTLIAPFSTHVSFKKIRINHYYSKSKEEYISKLSRGRVSNAEKRPFDPKAYDFTYWATKESDIDLSSFVDNLKNKIPETYT